MTAPLVVVAAAMAVPSGYYRPLEAAFSDRGWQAVTMATSGFERGEPTASRRHDWSYASEIARIGDHVAQARREHPERPVLLLGHSLGAQLAAGHQINGDAADGFVAVGASTPHHRHYPHGGPGVLLMGVSVPLVTRVVGHLPRPFFGGPGARTLMREWARFARTGRPPFPVTRRIDTPTLVVKLQRDPYAVTAAEQAWVDLFCSPEQTTRWTYRKSAVPVDGSTDHLAWVKRPDVVVEQIMHWWDERASSDALAQANASMGGQAQARLRSP